MKQEVDNHHQTMIIKMFIKIIYWILIHCINIIIYRMIDFIYSFNKMVLIIKILDNKIKSLITHLENL